MRLSFLVFLALLAVSVDVVGAAKSGSDIKESDDSAGAGDKEEAEDDEEDEEEEEGTGTKGWGKNFNEITKGKDGKMTITFASIDTNNDDKLSPDEFMSALKQVNPQASDGTLSRQQKAFFKKADKVSKIIAIAHH
jgi:hypothetical protein